MLGRRYKDPFHSTHYRRLQQTCQHKPELLEQPPNRCERWSIANTSEEQRRLVESFTEKTTEHQKQHFNRPEPVALVQQAQSLLQLEHNHMEGLQHQAAEAQQQGQSWHGAKPMLVSGMTEPSLAALQQQHVIDMLQSVTFYLQHDMQHMQQTCKVWVGCKQKEQLNSWVSCHLAAIDKLSNEPRRPWH